MSPPQTQSRKIDERLLEQPICAAIVNGAHVSGKEPDIEEHVLCANRDMLAAPRPRDRSVCNRHRAVGVRVRQGGGFFPRVGDCVVHQRAAAPALTGDHAAEDGEPRAAPARAPECRADRADPMRGQVGADAPRGAVKDLQLGRGRAGAARDEQAVADGGRAALATANGMGGSAVHASARGSYALAAASATPPCTPSKPPTTSSRDPTTPAAAEGARCIGATGRHAATRGRAAARRRAPRPTPCSRARRHRRTHSAPPTAPPHARWRPERSVGSVSQRLSR